MLGGLERLAHPDFWFPRQKPTEEVEIDWLNPLTRGLIGCYLPQGLSGPIKNLAENIGGDMTQTTVGNLLPSTYGMGLRGTDTGGGAKGAVSPRQKLCTGNASLVWLGRIIGDMLAGNTYGALISVDSDISHLAPYESYGIVRDTSTNPATSLQLGTTFGSVQNNRTGLSVISSADFGALTMFAANYIQGSGGSFSKNGKPFDAPAITSGAWTGATQYQTTPQFTLSRNGAAGQFTPNADSYMGLWYNRLLTDAEARELWRDPYQIFRPAGWQRVLRGLAAGITFDAVANSGYQAAASTYTFNRTVSGSERYLTVDVALLSAGQTVTSINDDNAGTPVAMTFLGAKSTISSVGRVECWGLVAPAAGTKQIQVNLSGSIASSAVAVSYNGVHQTSPTEGFNSAQATNVGAADASVSITSVADNCWIHAAVATDDTSVTAGQTTRNNVTGAGGSGANEDTGPITPAGVTAMSYTGVGALATWAIAGYALRPSASSSLASLIYSQLERGIRGMLRGMNTGMVR